MLDENQIYAAVAERRTSFDAMLWQVPVLSLTAQAFLFTIALDPGSSRAARAISAILSLVVSCLSMTLMARQRQAEMTDAHFLDEMEERAGIPTERRSSGPAWAARRNQTQVASGWLSLVPPLPGYKSWIIALMLFASAALGVLGLTAFYPSAL